MLVHDILANNGQEIISASPLVAVQFEDTKSGILENNHNMAYCFVLSGIEGLFRKDREPTLRYGRGVCDKVKDDFNCAGFFTSDELPRYGITRAERRYLLDVMGTESGDGNLVVMLAYPHEMAVQIRQYLINHFDSELTPQYYPELAS